jgi:plastocyanin
MNARLPPPRTRTRRQLLTAAAALLLGSLGASCAGFVQQLHVVTISDEKGYQPASVSVRVGDTVRWKNDGVHLHTVTDDPSGSRQGSLPSGAQPFNSGDILPGRTWSYTFTVPGQYQYVSTDEQGQPFQGTISVG